MKTIKRLLINSLFFVAAMALTAVSGVAQKQEFTGTVIGVGGQLGGVSRPFTLTLDSLTPARDVQGDVSILAEGGQDALLRKLDGKRIGYFSLGNGLGRDVNFAWETPTANGGRRITAVFERWMNLYELRYGTRSEDYPFSYVEITVDRNGKGEGTFIPAAKIYFDKKNGNQVDVENFGIYPARLAGVQLRQNSSAQNKRRS